MKTSGFKVLVVLSHAVVMMMFMLPLLILSGGFEGRHHSDDDVTETPRPLIGEGTPSLNF